MSKQPTDNTNIMPDEGAQSMQASQDLLNSFLTAPVTKLDADQYLAEDLDGVTQSSAGSGNLNFLSLQAAQVNEEKGRAQLFSAIDNTTPFFNAAQGTPLAVPLSLRGTDNAFSSPVQNQGLGGNGDDAAAKNSILSSGNEGGSSSASSFSSSAVNTQSVNSSSHVNGSSSSSSSSSSSTTTTTTTGQNGANGTDGTDGTNGSNGSGGGDTVTNNHYNTTTTTTNNNTTNNYYEAPDNIHTTINNTTDNLFETVDNTTDTLLETVNNTTENLFETVNNVTNNLFDTLTGGDGDPLQIGLSLDATLSDVSSLSLDVLNSGNVIEVLDETLDLSPILTPVTDLTGTILSGVSLDTLISPFQYDDSADDTDLSIGTDLEILGIQIPGIGLDVPLDLVEGLVGDIDLSLSLTDDLLGLPILGSVLDPILAGSPGADTDLSLSGLTGNTVDLTPVDAVLQTVLNPVEDLAGDVDIGGGLNIELLNLGADQNTSGPDTDITIPLDLQIGGGTLLSDSISVSVDPLESLLGDIDLDLGVAGNILGDLAPGLFDTENGGSTEPSLLSGVGDLLSGAASTILPPSNTDDTDLSLETGIGLLDENLVGNGLAVALDPVEDIIGDADIGGGVHLDLLSLGQDQNDAGATDTDLTIPLNLQILGTDIINNTLSVPLDPLETLIGDVDIDLGVATNLLGNAAPGLFDNAEGGSTQDTILSDAGGLASDLAAPVLDAAAPLLGPVNNLADSLIDNTNNLLSGGDSPLESVLQTVENTVGDVLSVLTESAPLPEGITTTLEGTTETAFNLLSSVLDPIDSIISSAVTTIDTTSPSTGGLDLGALGAIGSGLTTGLSSLTSWTETPLPDASGVLGGGLSQAMETTLPDLPQASAGDLALPAPIAAVTTATTSLLGNVLGSLKPHGGLFG